MAIVETLTLRTSSAPQPTLIVTIDDGGGAHAASTIRYTDSQTGSVVSVPMTFANCARLALACSQDGNPRLASKYT